MTQHQRNEEAIRLIREIPKYISPSFTTSGNDVKAYLALLKEFAEMFIKHLDQDVLPPTKAILLRDGEFSIAEYWHVEDVQVECPWLSSSQAMKLLRHVSLYMDAEIGINLEVIKHTADLVFTDIGHVMPGVSEDFFPDIEFVLKIPDEIIIPDHINDITNRFAKTPEDEGLYIRDLEFNVFLPLIREEVRISMNIEQATADPMTGHVILVEAKDIRNMTNNEFLHAKRLQQALISEFSPCITVNLNGFHYEVPVLIQSMTFKSKTPTGMIEESVMDPDRFIDCNRGTLSFLPSKVKSLNTIISDITKLQNNDI